MIWVVPVSVIFFWVVVQENENDFENVFKLLDEACELISKKLS